MPQSSWISSRQAGHGFQNFLHRPISVAKEIDGNRFAAALAPIGAKLLRTASPSISLRRDGSGAESFENRARLNVELIQSTAAAWPAASAISARPSTYR